MFSFLIEILQYFHFVDYLGLSNYRIMVIALGSSFSWLDFLAYTIGILIVVFLERINNKNTIFVKS